jgi:hypothetical protein
MMWIAYAIAWASSAAAASLGTYLTGSPWCLLVMVLPALISISKDSDSEEEKEEGNE